MYQDLALPPITVTSINPASCDEWYGVEIQFTWDFNHALYQRIGQAEHDAWFKTHKSHTGLYPVEKAVHAHVVKQILASQAWKDFYSKPRFTTAQEYEDGPERQVRIPRFENADDFCDWEFAAEGGYIGAATRD